MNYFIMITDQDSGEVQTLVGPFTHIEAMAAKKKLKEHPFVDKWLRVGALTMAETLEEAIEHFDECEAEDA